MEHSSVRADACEAPGEGDLPAAHGEERHANFLLLVVLALTPWIVIASLIRIGLRFL